MPAAQLAASAFVVAATTSFYFKQLLETHLAAAFAAGYLKFPPTPTATLSLSLSLEQDRGFAVSTRALSDHHPCRRHTIAVANRFSSLS